MFWIAGLTWDGIEIGTTELLCLFILKPVNFSYKSRTKEITFKVVGCSSTKITVSSGNCIVFGSINICGCMAGLELFMKHCNESETNIKSNGESGSPWRNPR